MLVEIQSAVFRAGPVRFKPGLNVVLGDDNASNSIGKSTLLMVIDFMLGGSSLLDAHPDLIDELGHHAYEAQFQFSDSTLRVRRRTDSPKFVFVVGEFGDEKPIALERYCVLLKACFGLAIEDLT